MPFGICTREKYPWSEFAEDCENGISTEFLKRVISKEFYSILNNRINNIFGFISASSLA